MFEAADRKLHNARTALQRLRALVKPPLVTNVQIISGPGNGEIVGIEDPLAFSEAFSSCVAQVRSVGDAIRNDATANKLPDFKEWIKAKIAECMSDELMTFIRDRRNSDLHEGECPFSFRMHPCTFVITDVVPTLPKGAVLRVNGTGPYWILPNTLDERHPYEIPNGAVFTVAIIDPPTMHKGKPLTASDPVTICAMAEKYYTELLREARHLFK